MEDDLLPNANDGTYFLPREPQDQVIARKKERAKTLEAIGVLEGLIQSLNERIDFYNSVSSITDEVKAEPAKFMHLYSAYKLTRDTLIQERNTIQDLIDTHKR